MSLLHMVPQLILNVIYHTVNPHREPPNTKIDTGPNPLNTRAFSVRTHHAVGSEVTCSDDMMTSEHF